MLYPLVGKKFTMVSKNFHELGYPIFVVKMWAKAQSSWCGAVVRGTMCASMHTKVPAREGKAQIA